MTDIELANRSDWLDLQGRLCRPNPYRSECEAVFTLEGGDGDNSISYGCLDEGGSADDRVWFESQYCTGSDYSGGSVTESNYRVLLAECERISEEQGLADEGKMFFQTFWGGHGTYAIALHIDKTPREVFDIMAALEDYPLISDDDHSELEFEQQVEAWERWGAQEYAQELEKRFEGDCDDVEPDKLYEHFEAAREAANVYWEDQSGAGQYIDMRRVAAAAEEPPEGFEPLADEDESEAS